MSLVSQELEKLAINAANEAIQLDKQGNSDMAISKYGRAVEILKKLCVLHPDAGQNRVYSEYISQYQERAKQIKNQVPLEREAGISRREKTDGLILSEKPQVRWSDVVGLEDAKEAIEDAIVFPYRRSDLFPLGWPRGILLFGPPGCGKTLLAAATAFEIDAAFYNVDAASIMSKWLGESERNVADLFESARGSSETGQAAIIFMDEVDSLVGVRSEEVGGEVRMRNQFMKEMDSIVDKNKKLHVYVVGATNKPWNLDVAFLRRFQKRVYVPLPNEKTRRDILKLYAMKLLQIGEDVDFNELAQLTEGYSGSDLYDIVQAVHLKVIREFFKSGNPDDLNSKLRPNTMNDYRNILQKRRPSVSKEILNQYRQWYSRFKAL
ncbi:MAG: AAA family ATPase [Candidatus Bathyarchaeota archaeon]|nr:MAG: AAA family ATPase [Candidatus Bathyarchaeota archaeon]